MQIFQVVPFCQAAKWHLNNGIGHEKNIALPKTDQCLSSTSFYRLIIERHFVAW